MAEIEVFLSRDSVCMADDIEPHDESFIISVMANSRDPIEDAVYAALNLQNYLPSVAGSSTWIATCMGRRFVFNHGSGARDIRNWHNVDPVGSRETTAIFPAKLQVALEYYLANSVDRIVRQLQAGQKPDRLYSDKRYD
jgi:hypothetical protein